MFIFGAETPVVAASASTSGRKASVKNAAAAASAHQLQRSRCLDCRKVKDTTAELEKGTNGCRGDALT